MSRKSRGKIVGQLLAEANLHAIMVTRPTAAHEVLPVTFAHDPATPFLEAVPVDQTGARDRFVDDRGSMREKWYYDACLSRAAHVEMNVTRHGSRYELSLQGPAVALQVTIHGGDDHVSFTGASMLAGMRGQFSGCIRASEMQGLHEYSWEYSDQEVNSFGETLTVDDISGEIVGVDSDDVDQEDKPDHEHEAGRIIGERLSCEEDYDDGHGGH